MLTFFSCYNTVPEPTQNNMFTSKEGSGMRRGGMESQEEGCCCNNKILIYIHKSEFEKLPLQQVKVA
jgi:hypothetical protein